MRIIFEQHQYDESDVKKDLADIFGLRDVNKKVSVSYVGYFYSPTVKDCVFILPKVLLKDKNQQEIVADVPTYKDADGAEHEVTPEDIITPEGQNKYLPQEYRKFIYEFSVWIYRSLDVYRKLNPNTTAIYYRQLPQEGKGRKHPSNTYLDIVLSLIRFNQENQNFILFTVKNLHRGLNKINWSKTIPNSRALLQDDNVVYVNPVNKKKVVNYEEELLVIYFSILNYLNDNYGFKTPINCQYDLIKGIQFESYRSGSGKIRLRQIKYKYFSDKMLQLWEMCYAFFDTSYKMAVHTDQKEYLLAKNFEIVFESMIDELIGDKNIPNGLKEQDDGKQVDHMYTYYGLTSSNDDDDQIYYIGDSKYYKNGHRLGRNSIYKQYTYARNVIQWNIDLFMNGQHNGWTDEEEDSYADDKAKYCKIRLRDDAKDPLTEGYNVIPNFFLSAYVNSNRKYIEKNNIRIHEVNGIHSTYMSYQFENRLFDRDTLILSHYDVNFLYVIYLYSRNRSNEKAAWRRKVRDLFREEIRKVLSDKFDFYAMKSIGNPMAGEQYIKEHYKELQGKLYRPYGDKNIYALALERKEGEDNTKSEVYQMLGEFFRISKVNLGYNPKTDLEAEVTQYQQSHPYVPTPKEWLPEYHLERYAAEYILIGIYHDQEHWDWITGKNDRGSYIYNVRLDKKRAGFQVKSRLRQMKTRFAILYQEGDNANNYHVFKIHDTAIMDEERMKLAMYPQNHGGPHGSYFIYRFDDEISIGDFDLNKLISERRIYNKDFVEGAPIFLTCEELLKYKERR